ncbi:MULTISPECIES: hypothetical protein [Hyphomonas]|uniref:hypothetical protein n=1 Tax=Hyphomonas TaxID=85 RepID=UPI003003551B
MIVIHHNPACGMSRNVLAIMAFYFNTSAKITERSDWWNGLEAWSDMKDMHLGKCEQNL